jgi:hypothetical protein
VSAVDNTQQLEWEARQRPRAGIVALLAALLTFGSDIWQMSLFRDAPKAPFVDALLKAVQPGPIGPTPSLRTPYFEFIDQHASSFVAANVVKGIGLIGVAWALAFLAAATRSRRTSMSRLVVYVVLVGGVLSAIATIVYSVAYTSEVSSFLAGPHTVDRAAQAGGGTALVTGQFIGLVGQFLLAAGYVLVGLNAMRAGLLTRFMGILACIIGALTIFPLGPLPVLQAFWLAALGALFLGRWPSGMPPAWRTGREEPWPRQAEAAAKRRAAVDARRAARGGRAAPVPAGDDDDPRNGTRESAAAQRKKRKRRT